MQDVDPGSGSLLPPPVKRGLWIGLGLITALALYLISVRGTAIIFDIATAVGSFCF